MRIGELYPGEETETKSNLEEQLGEQVKFTKMLTILVRNATNLTYLRVVLEDDIYKKRDEFFLYTGEIDFAGNKDKLDKKAEQLMNKTLDLEQEAAFLRSELMHEEGVVRGSYWAYRCFRILNSEDRELSDSCKGIEPNFKRLDEFYNKINARV